MLVTCTRRSTVVGTLAAMTFLVSPDCSALLLSTVARPLYVTPRLVLPGSLVATGTTTKRTSTPSTITTMPMTARTMDERRTDNSASSDSEHHTLPDRGSAGIILTGDCELLGPDSAGMEGANVVLLSRKVAKHPT